MRTKLVANAPQDIEFTLSVTMTLKKWQELNAQLPIQWPAMELRSAILDMVRQATAAFYPTPPEEEP